MRVLYTPSAFGINDTFDYSQGCIGNIGFDLFKHIGMNNGIHQDILVQNHILKNKMKNTTLYDTGWGLKKNPISLLISKKLLKKNKYDLINQPYIFYKVGFNPLFKKIKEYPFILSMCEAPHVRYLDEVDNKLEYFFGDVGKVFTEKLFNMTLNNCDKLIAVNQKAKKLYSHYLPEKDIEIIPYGVNVNLFKQSPILDNNNILVVSRLIKRRNIDYMIKSMPSILKEYPQTTLNIVGEGNYGKTLKILVKNLNIIKNVNFLNKVSITELLRLYKSCSLLCHFSEDDGWNQTALEAMSSGRPVVCFDAPHNDMVEHGKNGVKFDYLSVDKISETIKDLFSNHSVMVMMGQHARLEVTTKYSWSKIGQDYYNIYDKLNR